MKLSDRIYYDKVDHPDKLPADLRDQVLGDGELSRAIDENRSLGRLNTDPGPAPDRAAMLSRVYRGTEVPEEPKMTLLQRMFEGKRWYAQVGLATGLAAIVVALAIFLPTDDSLSPQPAFARTDGYRLNYNLGTANPNLINAKLAGPGTAEFINMVDEDKVVKTKKTIKIVTSDDLSEEDLAEIKESLGLVFDGELDVITLDSLINGTEIDQGQMRIYVTDPDETRIEQILTGALGEAVELDELELHLGEAGESQVIRMVISKPDNALAYFDGAVDDSDFIVSLKGLDLETGKLSSLAELGENLEVLKLDLSEIGTDLATIDTEAIIIGLEAAQDGLSAVDLEQLRAELDEETLKEVQAALEEARAEIAAIDISELAELRELGSLAELEGLEGLESLEGLENLIVLGDLETVIADEIAVAMAEIEAVKLDELQLTIEHQAQLAEAREQLKAAMVVVDEANLNDIVMQIDEISTIDLSEIESAIDEFKAIRIYRDGTPIDVETRIVDGELITSISVVGDDVETIDELKIKLSEVVTGLPDPEVTTSTWFYNVDSADTVTEDGLAISVMGNYFAFPEGASTEEIQAELDSWFKENHPDSEISTSIKIIDGADPEANQYVVMARGDDISWTANYCRMEDGNIIITTGENLGELKEIEEIDGTFSIYVEGGEGETGNYVVVTKDSSDDKEKEEKKEAPGDGKKKDKK